MFGVAIGGTSFLNMLLPFAFHRSDALVVGIQMCQGLIQVSLLWNLLIIPEKLIPKNFHL